MPMAAFCGQPHSESEVYFVKSTTIRRQPSVAQWYSNCDYSSHHSPSDECHGPRIAAFVTQRVTSTLSNRVPLSKRPAARDFGPCFDAGN